MGIFGIPVEFLRRVKEGKVMRVIRVNGRWYWLTRRGFPTKDREIIILWGGLMLAEITLDPIHIYMIYPSYFIKTGSKPSIQT